MSFIVSFRAMAVEDIPTTIDSRMKTIIYNPNEVFELTFFYGFQAFIEFSENEEIEIISLGESYPWRITPVGKYLFIRPMQVNANTNMLIITTERTYQFQIKSRAYEEGTDDELVYSVRFFYPDTTKKLLADMNTNSNNEKSIFDLDKNNPNLNFDYVMTGNIKKLAPVKTFDDGINTYFQFPNNNTDIPNLYAVDIKGRETLLDYTVENGFVVVNSIQMQFSLRNQDSILCIFNNKLLNINKK